MTTNGHKILFVDDEAIVRVASTYFLRQSGHKVTEADNARGAFDLYNRAKEHNPFDLLITDHNMGEFNGDWLVERIRECDSTTPIIVCSAHDLDILNQIYGALEVQQIKQKPLFGQCLGNTIEQILSSNQH